MASAVLLLEGFDVVDGLERQTAHQLYHVTGITSWEWFETLTNVHSAIGINPGDPFRGMGGCLARTIGPAVKINKGDGTYEALVPIFFDTASSYGGIGRLRSSTTPSTLNFAAPAWTLRQLAGTDSNGNPTPRFVWDRWDMPQARQLVRRLEPKLVGDIPSGTWDSILSLVGKPYKWQGGTVPYILRCPQLFRMNTGQSILTYVLETTTPVLGSLAGTPVGSDAALPALDWLDEYTIDFAADNSPIVGVWGATDHYGTPALVSTLPFWNNFA